MPFILRKIRKAKWWNDPSWLPQGAIVADALVDLKTEENKLSVWIIQDDQSNLSLVAVALIADVYKSVGKFDYALLELSLVEREGWSIEAARAKTPCQTANGYHRDIVRLSADDVLRLARLIKDKAHRERIPEWEVGKLVDEALVSGSITRVNDELQESLARNRHKWSNR